MNKSKLMEKKKIQESFWRSHNIILENFEQVKVMEKKILLILEKL